MSGQNWLRGRTIVYNPVPKPVIQPKRFRVGRIIWEALKRTCMLLGFGLLISLVITVISARTLVNQDAPSLPDKMVLLLDTSGSYASSNAPKKYLAELGLSESGELSVPDMVDAIDAAAKDKRIQALAMFLEPAAYDLSDYQELHAALKRFKASGKPVHAYANSFGGNSSGLGQYYLAALADEIWMMPVGTVTVPGLYAEMPFLRALLEKVGIKPEFFQRKEYKTAMEHFSAYGMSEHSREQMTAMINDIGDQFIGSISEDRKKLGGNFRQLINKGLYTDKEALQAGLIDQLKYRDEFVDALRKKIGGTPADKKPDFILVEEYAPDAIRQHHKLRMPGKAMKQIAVVTVEGMIVEGEGGGGYGMEDRFATALDIANAIMQAAEDKDIKAIVLRVNSPGGTPVAAEIIHRAVVRAKTQHNKPVIVSMGATAASGGYWISAPADKIYALDGTLTGSIGVVGGKFDASGLWDKLDVKWESVAYGDNGGMWSFNKPFSETERERFEASLDNVYSAFIERVTQGRKLKPEQVEQVAKGHVWTGRQAVKLGLVDEIGGLDKVLDDVAVKVGAASRYDLDVVYLPRPESKLEAVLDLLGSVSLPPFLPEGVMNQLAPLVGLNTDHRLVYESLPEIRP